jgi:SulP family sulfate permease
MQKVSQECGKNMIKASPKLARVIETDIDDPRYHVMAAVQED